MSMTLKTWQTKTHTGRAIGFMTEILVHSFLFLVIFIIFLWVTVVHDIGLLLNSTHGLLLLVRGKGGEEERGRDEDRVTRTGFDGRGRRNGLVCFYNKRDNDHIYISNRSLRSPCAQPNNVRSPCISYAMSALEFLHQWRFHLYMPWFFIDQKLRWAAVPMLPD